jgi:hypothetical protein
MPLTIRPSLRASLATVLVPRRGSRESRRTRARRTLASALAAVLFAHLALALAVETVKPEWRDPEYGHRIKQLRELRRLHPDRPLVVALGSSRTLMAISPRDMNLEEMPGSPLVYNFGQTGAGPLQINLTFQRILADGVKPDFLLVEVFPAALMNDGPAEDLMKAWQPRLNLGDIRRLSPYAAQPDALCRTWAANRAQSWYSLRFCLMNHWQPTWLPVGQRVDYQWGMMTARGWMPMPPISPALRAETVARARADFEPKLANFRIGVASDRAFRQIAAICRNEGIQLAFFVTAEGPEFQGWYKRPARQKIENYLHSLSAELEAPLFDCSGGFEEAEFADSHHMLPAGAARFSKKLADEYLKSWLR